MRIREQDISGLFLKIFFCIIIFVFAFLCFYPFYFIIINSISSSDAVSHGVYLWPKDLELISYQKFFQRPDIGQAYMISVARTGAGTAVTVFCCSMLGFLFTKQYMFIRTFLYRLVISTMYVSAGLIPWYLIMRLYHMQNNFLLYIMPTAVNAFYVVLLKTYFEQLPSSLEESAEIDGAGFFVIFFRIILPLSTPILATIAVYAAVNQWNSWQDAYFLVTNRTLKPLQLVLYNYLSEAERIAANMRAGGVAGEHLRYAISPETVRLTAIVVTVLPVLMVYPILQKYFTKGIMIGAVKG